MDLIEQLGGYEAAKEKYQALSDSDMITIGPVEFSAKDYFEDELLQYRRQHNIFEVGDKVVKTNSKIKHAHIRVVISTSPSGGAVLDYQGFPYKYPYIRHATDAEVDANRRLDL